MAISKDWRTYSAWGSLTCALLAVIATAVFFAYPKPVNDPSPVNGPEAIWMLATFPISLLGFGLGVLQRNVLGIAGLVICGCALLLLLLASIAV
jgi:hypothetical protein